MGTTDEPYVLFPNDTEVAPPDTDGTTQTPEGKPL